MKCSLCSEKIPNKNREELLNLKYNFLEYPNGDKEVFCPKHSPKEIAYCVTLRIKKGQQIDLINEKKIFDRMIKTGEDF
jgi:hypothetical protein